MSRERVGLDEWLSQNGIPVSPTFQKKTQRFSLKPGDNDDDSGWLYSSEDARGRFCRFGDHRDPGSETSWYENGPAQEAATKAERARIEEERRESHEKAVVERRLKQDEAAVYARKLWDLSTEGAHSYLERKKLSGAYGARILVDKKTDEMMLVVPMFNTKGELRNLERIYADGRKKGLTGCERTGCYFPIAGLDDFTLVCEGYATGVTLHEATGRQVIVAFNCHNLEPVIESFVGGVNPIPATKIIICGDEDQFTEKPKNPGRTTAVKVASKFGTRVCFPNFKSLETKPTDWNDLACLEGLSEVRAQLETRKRTFDEVTQIFQEVKKELDAEEAAKTPPPSTDEPEWYVEPLGFQGTTYYYTTSDNKQITELTASQHKKENLLSMMPYEYWADGYMSEKGSINFTRAAADLMHSCRRRGQYDAGRVRGRGCWRDDGRVVIHLGEHILVDGERHELRAAGSRFVYRMKLPLPDVHVDPLTEEEGRELRRTAGLMTWTTPEAPALFAGYCAVMRIAGALPWRPHLWLTGAAGAGKSKTAVKMLRDCAGEWGENVEGETSAAGVRQMLGDDSRPVIFDDADTDDRRGKARMKQMLEYVRQASQGGNIVKGTPGGKALSFKVNCTFAIGAIRVPLSEEADLSRFTVLELAREKKNDWPTVRAGVERISPEYGERLFARMVRKFPEMDHALREFKVAVDRVGTGREADQIAPLLAGLWVMENDRLVTREDAERLVAELFKPVAGGAGSSRLPDEVECVSRLLSSSEAVKLGQDNVRMTYARLVRESQASLTMLEQLELFGISVKEDVLWVANRHPSLERVFKDTKWDGCWKGALTRLSHSREKRAYFRDGQKHWCVGVPLDVVFARNEAD